MPLVSLKVRSPYPLKKIFHENLKYISNTYLYLHYQLLEVYGSLVYAGTDQKINSGAICQNKTAKEIFNIPESFTIFLEGICQMPDTKKQAGPPNIFFHIPGVVHLKNNNSSFPITINSKTLQCKN